MDSASAGVIWMMAGVCCFVLEMALPRFINFFFGLGAWIVALFCWFYPVSLSYQLAIFLSSSLLSLFLLRGILRKIFKRQEPDQQL